MPEDAPVTRATDPADGGGSVMQGEPRWPCIPSQALPSNSTVLQGLSGWDACSTESALNASKLRTECGEGTSSSTECSLDNPARLGLPSDRRTSSTKISGLAT